MKKELGIVGLGKMGGNMARRMAEKGWKVAGLDYNPDVAESLKGEGVLPVKTYAEMAVSLAPQRITWLLVPAGKAVDDALFGPGGIAESFSPGDIVIDGGNSFYKDARERAEKLKAKGIHFIDVGTSGGPVGARNGACLMIGGNKEIFESIEDLFRDFAKEKAYQFFEGNGAGHFVKMIHNGIEYGMMQALGEGFEILEKSDFKIDLPRAADIYNNGSVIESRLVGWLQAAFKAHGPELADVSNTVSHTGEGEWTVKVAKEMGVEVKVIEDSFQFRVDSAKKPSYTGKIVSALREQFGGHSVKDRLDQI
jgi:6-phosphogluconate dehydrogenase